VNRVAVVIGQHLEFDMAGLLEKLLHVHHVIVECGACLGLGHRDRGKQGRFNVDDAHASTAAAARGFDNDRVTN
jgi:hypothetical protein